MDKFISDLQAKITGYYDSFVELLPKLIMAIIVLMVLMAIGRRIQKLVNRRLAVRMDDPLLARFLARMTKFAIYIVAILLAMQILGLAGIAAGIVTGASVSAIVIGFAFKDIGENFLAGIMLAFDRPFRVGDTVELTNLKGTIIGLNLRTTHLKSFDGKDIYIPNASVVKNPVINYTIDGFIRYDFDIGIDYGEDVSKAIRIVHQVLEKNKDILQEDKKPDVNIGDLNASSLNLNVKYWLDTFNAKLPGAEVRTRLIDQIIDALSAEGFYLPGDVLEIKNYKDSPLKEEKTEKENKEVTSPQAD